jgi:hypothetical protein
MAALAVTATLTAEEVSHRITAQEPGLMLCCPVGDHKDDVEITPISNLDKLRELLQTLFGHCYLDLFTPSLTKTAAALGVQMSLMGISTNQQRNMDLVDYVVGHHEHDLEGGDAEMLKLIMSTMLRRYLVLSPAGSLVFYDPCQQESRVAANDIWHSICGTKFDGTPKQVLYGPVVVYCTGTDFAVPLENVDTATIRATVTRLMRTSHNQAVSKNRKRATRPSRNARALGSGEPLPTRFTCDFCLIDGARKKCDRCRLAYYCCSSCQEEHWPAHKTFCEAPR